MFDEKLRELIKDGLLDAVGRKPKFWVSLTTGEWYKLGVLTEEDVQEIKTAIDRQYGSTEQSEV